MFTYNTMQTFIGVLGMEPLHMVAPASDDPRRLKEFPDELIDHLLKEVETGIRPRDIVTTVSLRNAIAVVARSFARIHRRNLLAQGILPLVFDSEADYDRLRLGDSLKIRDLRGALEHGESIIHARVGEAGEEVPLRSDFSAQERRVLLAGGLLALSRSNRA